MLKSLKKFTDHQQHQWLLGCDAMYAHNSMDGLVKRFTLASLRKDAQSGHIAKLSHSFKVDTQFGCNATEVFTLGGKDYIAMGLDDGSLHVFDYSENQGKPISD